MKFGSAFLAATLFAATPAAATQLLVNGGFENPGFGGTTSYYNIGSMAGTNGGGPDHGVPSDFGWSVSNGNVDIISYLSYGPAPANGGNYGLDLVGYGSTGQISQTFGTVAGRIYNVSLDYSANPGFNGAQADVLVNGVALTNVTGTAGSWATYTGSFIGTGSPTTFAINETLGGGNGGVFLDKVSVSAVPEPATWAMMLIGFAAMGFAGFRRARKDVKFSGA